MVCRYRTNLGDFRHRRTLGIYKRTWKRAKLAERNWTTCKWIFHQLAAKNLNVNVVQRSTASVIRYSTGKKKSYIIHLFDRPKSGFVRAKKYLAGHHDRHPAVCYFEPWVTVIRLSPSQVNGNLFSVSRKIFVQVKLSRSPYQEGQNTNVQRQTGFANSIDEWSQFDFCFTNFGVILEYLESSITTKKATFRLSSKVSWHVYTIVRDTRSSCGGPLTWKAQIHGSIHRANFDSNLPPSCFVMQYI